MFATVSQSVCGQYYLFTLAVLLIIVCPRTIHERFIMKRNQPNQLAGAYGTGATRAEVSRFNLLFGDKSDEPEHAGKTKNKLPSAICSYILTFLDIQSLIRGRLVSKLFSKHASKPCSLKTVNLILSSRLDTS